MGLVYRQAGRRVWLLKYYQDGRPIVESARTTVKDDATTLLKRREAAIVDGLPMSNRIGRLRFDAAAAALLQDYRLRERRSLAVTERRITKHLAPYFGGRRLATIATTDVKAFIAHRQDVGVRNRKGQRVRDVSNAEINRELTLVKRMFSIAIKDGLQLHRPYIPLLPEHNVRTGFFEPEQIASVLAHLPAFIQPVIRFAYLTGWRVDSEILPLEWRQVDFAAGEVRLDPGTTKNDEGRVFPMTVALRQLLETQHTEHVRLKTAGQIVPWVFFRLVANGRGGEKFPRPIAAFTKAWKAACRAAGCPGRIPHDLRRTAVRNLVRAVIPERVAMTMTGHKTRSVFERYNIVSQGDLRDAARRLDSVSEASALRSKG